MSTPIPPPLRAAAGLAALAIDSARKVPQQLVGLPVLAVSTALQASLKAQQAYAGLVARGDEVLGQLRGQQDAPWARFDEDEPAGRPASAFDAASETALSDAALVDDLDRVLDPDLEPDVLTLDEVELVETEFLAAPGLTEAAAGGLDVADLPGVDADGAAEERAALAGAIELDPPGPDPAGSLPAGGDLGGLIRPAADLDGRGLNGTVVDLDAVRAEGSGTEPGADLPAVGQALAADAAAAGAAVAGDLAVPPPAAVGDPDGGELDGYLAVEAPIAGYDALSIPQLRGRLRSLSAEQVEALVGYERANRARPPYLTMLENRLSTLRSR